VTTLFNVVNAVMLKPLTYRDADRIVTLSTLWTKTGADQPSVSVPDYHDWLLQGVWLAIIGLAVGLAGAFAASRLLTTMLFGVRPTDR